MTMGSERLVTQAEAASILEVSVSSVQRYARQGTLRPRTLKGFGSQLYYSLDAVLGLVEARTRGKTLPEVNETAEQAWAMARVAEKKLEGLMNLLGLDTPGLAMHEESVCALYLEAEHDLKQPIRGMHRINYWADVFFSLCDVYLDRVGEVMDTKEPWRRFLDLSAHLVRCEELQLVGRDSGDEQAYARLRVARQRLRESVFTFILRREGARAAKEVFPKEFFGEHHEVMILATTSH